MSAVFLKLLNMSIAAGWLVVAVIVLRLCLKKAPKAIHCALWALVAIRLLCPFSLESNFSLIPEGVANGSVVSEWTDDYIGEIDIHHPNSVYYDAAIGAGREPISDGEGGYYVVTKHDQLGEPATIKNTVVPVLSWIWIAGVAALLLYAATSYLRIRSRVKVSLNRKDNIWLNEQVDSPFILGVIRPKIYLPFGMDEVQMEHVVAHEQAHLSRRDHWWKPLGFILLAVYWFNPLMWVAYILLCRDIELACDEKVIRDMDTQDKKAYSEALLACSVPRRVIAACPLAFGEVGVKKRIASVLHYKKPAFWILIVALIASISVAVCFMTNPKDAIEGSYHIEGYGIYNNGSEYYIVVNDGVELKCTKEQYEQVASLMELFRTGELEDTPIRVKYEQFLISYKRGTVIELEIPENERFGKTYTYEKEGIMGDFTITLFNDGTFSYYEGMASSYLGFGSWKQEGDIITMTDDGHGGLGLVNHFEFDKTDLIFVEEGSSNFIYVKVQDGERFMYAGESVKPEEATAQLGGSQTLSLDDVIMLSRKGYDLTWSDFEPYRYTETGSGLYIRVYEINEMFELWIGGGWPDEDPMYIWLTLADDPNTRIDIRDGGVEAFITKDHSETLLNRAIYDAIINCNLSETTYGLNNCASFVMLDKEEVSGTPVAGSTDHVGVVTVYGLALYQGYDLVDGELYEEAGSHTPVAITFDVRNGRYSLKEYWRPGDGTYYEPDIREKFPDKIEDEAMNTQKYIAAQKQECYVQAMRNNGEEAPNPDQQALSPEEQSAAVHAIFTNLRTNWWNGKQTKNCAYESAAFECLRREENGNIVNLYGYGGYFRWDRSKACMEQWHAPTVVTLDTDTHEILDLWWPGDGAAYESSILDKFPEEISSSVAAPDPDRSITVRNSLMEASKAVMVSSDSLTTTGTTRRFGVQGLRLEISNVLSTHKTWMLAEGIEPHEYVVVSCTPESKITVLNPGMSDPTYAEDGKAHPQWGLSYIGETERTRITDETQTVPVTSDLEGIYDLEASLFVIQLKLVD